MDHYVVRPRGDRVIAPTSSADSAPPAPVRWRRLAWVTWRQHRAMLTAALGVLGLAAVLVTLAGLLRRGGGPTGVHWPRVSITVPSHGEEMANDASRTVLQIIPVLAGVFLGAPLVARELETRTVRMTWTHGAGRSRWLVAQVAPLAGLVAAGALGLAFLARWGLTPPGNPESFWSADFTLNPLPFAGWTVAAFCLGVLLGAAVRRSVPAMAATAAGYGILMYETLGTWRTRYLPPVRSFDSHVQFQGRGGAYYSLLASSGNHPPLVFAWSFGLPDGRLLPYPRQDHTAAWLRAHHLGVWMTYQPSSRYGLFELIEFGWLAVLSVILVAVTVVLIRRRSA
jgi:hypothetical protein